MLVFFYFYQSMKDLSGLKESALSGHTLQLIPEVKYLELILDK